MNETTAQNGAELEAGRELDIQVAAKVFGWKVLPAPPPPGFDESVRVWAPGYHDTKGWQYSWAADCTGYATWGPPDTPGLPDYSTNIVTAWAVHREMCSHLFSFRERYFAALTDVIRERIGVRAVWPHLLAHLEPVDFCRAALLACEAR